MVPALVYEGQMTNYIVHCEFKGRRKSSIQMTVAIPDGSSSYPEVVACETAEWMAQRILGGELDQWFAWKVEPGRFARGAGSARATTR